MAEEAAVQPACGRARLRKSTTVPLVGNTPSPQPYGQIEFEVVDPNGYVLVFAQPM
jgi:hypothetical protein